MKKGKVVALHIDNSVSFHYTEDITQLLKNLDLSKENVLGETTPQEYLKNEGRFQREMQEKKWKRN